MPCPPPAGMRVTTLFPEECFPVCSPNYLAQFKEDSSPEEIFGKALLLYLDDAQKDWITWAEWFEAVNYPIVKPKNR